MAIPNSIIHGRQVGRRQHPTLRVGIESSPDQRAFQHLTLVTPGPQIGDLFLSSNRKDDRHLAGLRHRFVATGAFVHGHGRPKCLPGPEPLADDAVGIDQVEQFIDEAFNNPGAGETRAR